MKGFVIIVEIDGKIEIQPARLLNPTKITFWLLFYEMKDIIIFFQGSSDTKLLCSTLSIHLRSD